MKINEIAKLCDVIDDENCRYIIILQEKDGEAYKIASNITKMSALRLLADTCDSLQETIILEN